VKAKMLIETTISATNNIVKTAGFGYEAMDGVCLRPACGGIDTGWERFFGRTLETRTGKGKAGNYGTLNGRFKA
jgi:hypothetical protein